MEIDVIEYTSAQLALLSEEQLQEVKEAQLKKNELLRERAEKLQAEKRRLINNGMFFSYLWEWTKGYWEEYYKQKIGWVREGLLFYLHYEQGGAGEAPYPLDYALTETERMDVVKGYYMETYNDARARLAAFKEDKAAAKYLGESYAALYDFLAALANRPA